MPIKKPKRPTRKPAPMPMMPTKPVRGGGRAKLIEGIPGRPKRKPRKFREVPKAKDVTITLPTNPDRPKRKPVTKRPNVDPRPPRRRRPDNSNYGPGVGKALPGKRKPGKISPIKPRRPKRKPKTISDYTNTITAPMPIKPKRPTRKPKTISDRPAPMPMMPVGGLKGKGKRGKIMKLRGKR